MNRVPPLSVEELLHRHAREAALELLAAAEQAQTELDLIRAESKAQREHLEGVVGQARQALRFRAVTSYARDASSALERGSRYDRFSALCRFPVSSYALSVPTNSIAQRQHDCGGGSKVAQWLSRFVDNPDAEARCIAIG